MVGCAHPLSSYVSVLVGTAHPTRSVLCNRQGYNMPVICTPEELMGE